MSPRLIVGLTMLACLSMCHGLSLLGHQQSPDTSVLKRLAVDGNPCKEAEKPFPCKTTPTCIPMGYLCDHNLDCEDGYDENPEVCTAAHRPPVEDILQFLESSKSWIIDNLFGGKDIAKVAHGLAVSQNVDDFKQRLQLSSEEVAILRRALEAVHNSDQETLEMLGMPRSAWNEVSFIFAKLIKSGFSA